MRPESRKPESFGGGRVCWIPSWEHRPGSSSGPFGRGNAAGGGRDARTDEDCRKALDDGPCKSQPVAAVTLRRTAGR